MAQMCGSSRCLQLGQKRVRLQGFFWGPLLWALRMFDLKLGLIYSSFTCVDRLAVAGEERTSCRCHAYAEWGVPPEWWLLVTLWGSFLYQVHKLYCSLVITRGLQRLSRACVVISMAEKSCRLKASSAQINKWWFLATREVSGPQNLPGLHTSLFTSSTTALAWGCVCTYPATALQWSLPLYWQSHLWRLMCTNSEGFFIPLL